MNCSDFMFRLSSFKYTSRKYRSTLQIWIQREYTDTEMISYDSKRNMKIENCTCKFYDLQFTDTYQPEQPIIIACIIAYLIQKKSQFLTKFLRSGIPFLL